MTMAQPTKNAEVGECSTTKHFSVKHYVGGAVLLVIMVMLIFRLISNAHSIYGMETLLSFIKRGSEWLFVFRLTVEIVILFNWRFAVGIVKKLFKLSNRTVYVLLQAQRYARMLILAEVIFIVSKLVRVGLLP